MKRSIISLLAISTILIGGAACTSAETDNKTHAEEVVGSLAAEPAAKPAAEEKAEVEEPAKPEYTTSQENAIASAADYLDYSAFSKKGLIDQLEFEDYSKADARFAANHIKVDWNEQAAAAAADYLDNSSFSKAGLIEQLEFEGYTSEQAAYGVSKTGL